MYIHCTNSKCKNYWEDSCVKDLNSEMVCIDSNGKCEDFQEGKCEWYGYMAEGERLKKVEEISSMVLYLADNSDYKTALYNILSEVTGIKDLNEDIVRKIARKYFEKEQQD